MIWQFLSLKSAIGLELEYIKLDHVSKFPEEGVKTQFTALPMQIKFCIKTKYFNFTFKF